MHPNLALNTNVLRVKFGNIFQGTAQAWKLRIVLVYPESFSLFEISLRNSTGMNSIEVMNFNAYVNGNPLVLRSHRFR